MNKIIFVLASYSYMVCYLILLYCRHSRKPWSRFINADNQHLVSPEVIYIKIWKTVTQTLAQSVMSYLFNISLDSCVYLCDVHYRPLISQISSFGMIIKRGLQREKQWYTFSFCSLSHSNNKFYYSSKLQNNTNSRFYKIAFQTYYPSKKRNQF